MPKDGKIDYIEFPASDIARTKAFFATVFGWEFVDYGGAYTAFSDQGVDGGFYLADQSSQTENGAALVVFYSTELEALLEKIEAAGGAIVRPIFSFPDGRRFHFTEPCGNELAVWSDEGLPE